MNMKHIKTFESFLNEFGPMYASQNRDRGSSNPLVKEISRLDKILMSTDNSKAEMEWDEYSSELLAGEEDKPKYWADLDDQELEAAIDKAKEIAKKYNLWLSPQVEDLVHDMTVKIKGGRYAGATGKIHDFQLTDDGKLVDDQVHVLIDKPGNPFAYLGLDDILIK